MIVTLTSEKAERIAKFSKYTRVHLQVYGPNTVRVAVDEQTLIVPHATGQAQGLSFVQASGVVALTWIGELWAIGSGPDTSVDFEIPKEV